MDKKDNGVCNYLDCSTTHITEEDDKFLTNYGEPFDGDLIIYPNEYGYWLHLMGMHENPKEFALITARLSDSLQAVFLKAKKEDCIWVKLDCDGFEHDDLPKYDW